MVAKKVNFDIGEEVISDSGTDIESLVTIVSFEHNNLFAIVKDNNGLSWMISTNKLTKKQIQ